MQKYVVLDLETTGLDAKEDAIIEIAMLMVDENGKEIDRYDSLINPGFQIKEEITFLTNITNEDLEEAPFFEIIRSKIVDFLNGAVIVGHNVDFDIAFLEMYGVSLQWQGVIDTFKIANFCSFHLKSLNLSNIAESFKYSHVWAHRAMSDVEATAHIFGKYREIIADFSPLKKSILSGVVSRMESSETWKNAFLLNNEQRENSGILEEFILSIQKIDIGERKIISDTKIPDFSEVLKSWTELETREEQQKMLSIVEKAFEENEKVVIEAPTWVGKTIAYLLPAVLHSIKTGEQIFVSTNTKTLQDQIMEKDIPKLRSLLQKFSLDDFAVQKLKWRRNYVSIARFSDFFSSQKFTFSEAVFVLKIAFWMLETKTWELDEISLYWQEYSYVDEIVATNVSITSKENTYSEKEFLLLARNGAKKANIVVVNHALLLNEFLDESSASVLPKIERLILDEVHNLESVWTEALKTTFALEDLEFTFTETERAIHRFNLLHKSDPFLFPEIKEQSESIMLTASMLFEEFDLFAGSLFASAPSGYAGWRASESLVKEDFYKSEYFTRAKKLLDSLFDRVREFERYLFLAPDELMRHFERVIERFDIFLDWIRAFLSTDSSIIRIFSKRENLPIKLITTKLSIWPILKEELFKNRKTVIATSATLSVGENFEYIKRVLSLDDFRFEKLATDFDYNSQALLYIPSNLGDVRKDSDKQAIVNFLKELLVLFSGRTLMLFTAFSAIKEMALALGWFLRSKNIHLLTQGMSGGKHKILSEYKKNAEKSVLFGTESFWEWVDIPGQDLELLIIHKFPFAVPTDPIFLARSALYKNPFTEYALPNMIIKLKQWLGRLIRTKEDKGIMVLLDQRIHAEWGGMIVDSLPKWLRIRSIPTEEFIKLLRQSPKFAEKKVSW